MNTRNSIYDTLNSGRNRRPGSPQSSSLQDLEATIGGIEERLERMNSGKAASPYADDITERMRKLSADVSGPMRTQNAIDTKIPTGGVDRLSRQIERARQEEASLGSMNAIMAEINQLRSEIRHLPKSNHDEWGVALRKEVEAIKSGITGLAREDTLRSVGSRWDQYAQRSVPLISEDPVIEALLSRVEDIQHAVSGLPQTQSLSSLEEKIRILASAIDTMSRRSPEINGVQLAQIEDRLDEISRAIVASSVSVQPIGYDNGSMDRIELRLGSLNARIDDLLNVAPDNSVHERIAMLANKVDVLASKSGAPMEQMVRMASQMEIIATKLTSMDSDKVDPHAIASGLEDRLYEIAARLEQSNSESGRENRAIFAELESRLEELSTRIQTVDQGTNDYPEQILSAVEQRFSQLSQQLNTKRPDPLVDPAFAHAIEQRFADLSQQLSAKRADSVVDPAFASTVERRFDEITKRLNETSSHLTGQDPDAIVRLEMQVQNLSRQLAEPKVPAQGFGDLSPRLAAIEQSLLVNHDALLDAARNAAEDVLRSAQLAPNGSIEQETARELANDLKSLDILARKSDERNTKTFEAIHDTLLKIVERLNTIETSKPVTFGLATPEVAKSQVVAELKMPEAKLDLGTSAPAFDSSELIETDDFGQDIFNDRMQDMSATGSLALRSPKEVAAAAAIAASDVAVQIRSKTKPAQKSGFLSGLTNVLRGGEKQKALKLAGMTAPNEKPLFDDMLPVTGENGAMLGATAVAMAGNNPIEPGNGTPDLNTIMKRVRDERRLKGDVAGEDTSKSDFLAAARRAAQAAAADSEILKNRSSKAKSSDKSALADLYQRQRKPIIMAAVAIILALTGLQLKNALFSNDASAPVISSATELAPASDAISNEPAIAKATTDDQILAAIPSDKGDAAQKGLDTATPLKTAATPVEKLPDVTVAAPAVEANPQDIGTKAAQDKLDVVAAAPVVPAPDATATPENTQKDAASAELPAVEVGPIALREAAGSGDAKAQFEVASRYTDGRGVAKDLKKAASWYQKAADIGFAPAQFRLGSFYEKGLGVERSPQKAKTLYQLSAEQGNASAMHNLAVLFATGASGPADNDSAVLWFVKAAELGVKDSQFNLGILAAKGLGVPQNLEESYKWFALAAKSGDKDAASKRDEIANAMRPEQLKKARATTELWKAKPINVAANAVEIPPAWNTDGGQTANVDMKKAIRNIQAILNQNGYDAGKADGSMGEKTRTAIASYQKSNGMKPTGEVDEALVKSLLTKVKK